MDARLHASFEAAHADLANQFAESQSRDKAFLESISTTTSMLAAPLDKELIETTVIQEGRPVTEIMEMGKRIMQFKRIIEKNEAELKEYWKQWDDLQDEYLELGIEIFGPEAFGGAADEARETGYKKEMEILDIEHNAAINELMSEVEKVSEQMLTKMKESEKVCTLYESVIRKLTSGYLGMG
jgi:phosphopantothenoylcysteine decarboxylase